MVADSGGLAEIRIGGSTAIAEQVLCCGVQCHHPVPNLYNAFVMRGRIELPVIALIVQTVKSALEY